MPIAYGPSILEAMDPVCFRGVVLTASWALMQVCPKGLNPGKAIAKIKQSVHSGAAS